MKKVLFTVFCFHLTKDEKYFQYMDREYKLTTDSLFSKEDGLYFRDKNYLPEGKVSLVFSCTFAHSDNMDKHVSAEFKIVGESIQLSATN